MIKSIFDLEARFDFKSEYNKLIHFIHNPIFSKKHSTYTTSYWDIASMFFIEWPFRGTAFTIEEYFNLFDLQIGKPKSEEECFCILQFIYDYTDWLDKNTYNLDDLYLYLELNSKYIQAIFDNIEEISEKMNFDLVEINEHYTFIKRDSDVDSVLKQLDNEDDVRLYLLTYNDFRIEEDLDSKKNILKLLGDWLEPKRKYYDKVNSKLTNDIFYLLNVGCIRHNNSSQIIFSSEEEQIKMYDKLFKLIIHLIRSDEIKNIQNEIKGLKQ